jgi:hypothetical protein
VGAPSDNGSPVPSSRDGAQGGDFDAERLGHHAPLLVRNRQLRIVAGGIQRIVRHESLQLSFLSRKDTEDQAGGDAARPDLTFQVKKDRAAARHERQ